MYRGSIFRAFSETDPRPLTETPIVLAMRLDHHRFIHHHHHVRHSMAYCVSTLHPLPIVRSSGRPLFIVFYSCLTRSRTVRIPFASNKHATIAKQVIDVDAELQKDAVKRTLTVEGDELIASVLRSPSFTSVRAPDGRRYHRTFQTLTIRLARLAINGFLENVDLVVRTIGEFGREEADNGPVTETPGTSESK